MDRPARDVFDHVVAGVDGSEPGFEAVRQAARLVAPGGTLELFAALHASEAARAGMSAPAIAAELERQTLEAVQRAEEIAGEITGETVRSRVVRGAPLPSFLHALGEDEATVAVVGTHGHRRLTEILIGGVAGGLLHEAPCSVLVARPPDDADRFP